MFKDLVQTIPNILHQKYQQIDPDRLYNFFQSSHPEKVSNLILTQKPQFNQLFILMNLFIHMY